MSSTRSSFLPLSWKGKHFRGFDAHEILPDQTWFGFTEDKKHRLMR